MEQLPRSTVRGRHSFGLLVTVVATLIGAIGIVLLVLPRGAGQVATGSSQKTGAETAANVSSAANLPQPKEAVRFTQHFCPLASDAATDTKVVPSPMRGWSRLQDATYCFTIDYPSEWRMENNAGSVYFWAPDTDGPQKNGLYWDADLFVIKPYQTALDEGEEYAQFIKKPGVRVRRTGLLMGSWGSGLGGDGFPTSEVFQERKAFTGRGEFGIHLQNDPKDVAKRLLLEKIADSFTAQ